MKNKKVFTGWMAKDGFKQLQWDTRSDPHFETHEYLWKSRKSNKYWSDANWPPEKVRITIERVV